MDRRTKLLYDHWRTTRRGKRAPYRHDIDPAQFRGILDSVFVLDWNSTTDVRYRLAGSRLCESFGMELRGMNILALWQGEARARFAQLLHRVVTEPCVGHAVGIQENEGGYSSDFEILLLPLKRDDGTLKRIIGCNVLTRGTDQNARAFPISSRWIDGITVYEITVKDEEEQITEPAPCLISSVNGRDSIVASPGSAPAPARSMQTQRPFHVIEGGLARKQG